MRPLKHGPVSFVSHMFVRNNTYYYRANVPTDLRHYFPTTEIKKSLKTKESKTAKLVAISFEYNVQQAFAMLRTDMLPEDMVQQLVERIAPVKRKQPVTKGRVLADVIPGYIEAKKAEWTDKTKMEVDGVVKLLVDILGDVEITAITRPVVLELRSTLQKLPPNMYKRYPGQTIQQVLSCKDVEPMSTKTVNKHVSRLGSVLKYCIEEGMIASNPAIGLKLSEKKRPDEERDAYSSADVKKIVGSLPTDSATPERYWIPLIGLYSGMRLNEICQLYVSDVVKFDGLWCFSINGEKDKHIKNAASERLIPVHPTLIDLGLLQYVEKQKSDNNPRLWVNLTYCPINGYSNSFGKWYQRFNRLNVTDDTKRVFQILPAISPQAQGTQHHSRFTIALNS